MRTVADAFFETVQRWGTRPFLEILPETARAYGEQPGTMTYEQAAVEVTALAARYRQAGAGAGHRVGLMLDNRPAFFLHWLALNACGAGVVPLNPDLRPAELDYLIGHSALVMAVTAPAHLAVMQSTAVRAGSHVAVTLGDDVPDLEPASGTGDECALLYTSGTTGRPKGCILGQEYFLRAGAWYNATGGLCAIRPGEDRLITPLPMTHMNAMAYSTMAMVMSGGCIVPLDRFHPRTWWDSVRAGRASIVHYLGVMPSMLLGLPAEESDTAHDVRFGFGAGVDRRHQAVFEARFGFPLLEAWAMTETGAGAVVIANRTPRRVGISSFGAPEPEMELRIVDEAGGDVDEGAPGEMVVRAAGPDPRAGFFMAYLHDPDATAAAWAGGWFHTGDVVRREDGQLIFVDRRKNVIRRSGENIAAVEVESVLRRHPAIREVAVAATPDEMRGEEVLACIVVDPGLDAAAHAALAGDLVRAALEELSYFKVPGYVAFVDALPLTATQKIQRGELKAWAATLPGQPNCIDTRALKIRQRTSA